MNLSQKLAYQFENKVDEAVRRYTEEKTKYGLRNFFRELHEKLQEKSATLREIASCKRMIEELEKQDSTLLMLLKDETALSQQYPKDHALWLGLKNQYTEAGLFEKTTNTVARSAITMASGVEKAINWASRNTLGRMAPQHMMDKVQETQEKVARFKDSITPLSNDETKKLALIAIANDRISELAQTLNSNDRADNAQIKDNDFDGLSSQNIEAMADKAVMIKKVLNIQKSLQFYQIKHYKEVGFIVKKLSNTIFRSLINDSSLLNLEAKKLEKSLEALRKDLENKDHVFNKEVSEAALNKSMLGLKVEAQKIFSKSAYNFFNYDTKKRMSASEELCQFASTCLKVD